MLETKVCPRWDLNPNIFNDSSPSQPPQYHATNTKQEPNASREISNENQAAPELQTKAMQSNTSKQNDELSELFKY